MLAQGDAAPWFDCRSSIRPVFKCSDLGGQYVVLSFLGSSTFPPSRELVDTIERERACLDSRNILFFGISVDPEDEKQARLQQKFPRIYYLWDFDGSISMRYGAAAADGKYFVHTLVLDPNLRVIARIEAQADHGAHALRVVEFLKSLRPTTTLDGFAPILILPHVFEPQLCRSLIDRHGREGMEEIGIVQDVDGKSVNKIDHTFKRRRDWTITDPALLSVLDARLRTRVFPEIKKSFAFNATHIERFVVGCYDADAGGGYFRPHRDNTTRAAAHRRFAVSIVLDADTYEGGELHFPEYGARGYRPPTGGAVVFSCTLVHEVSAVTRGRRYACLPFVYDDEAALIREANRPRPGDIVK